MQERTPELPCAPLRCSRCGERCAKVLVMCLCGCLGVGLIPWRTLSLVSLRLPCCVSRSDVRGLQPCGVRRAGGCALCVYVLLVWFLATLTSVRLLLQRWEQLTEEKRQLNRELDQLRKELRPLRKESTRLFNRIMVNRRPQSHSHTSVCACAFPTC